MTSKRGRSYYVKRTFRGIGRVEKSLRTSRLGVARHRETVLLKLHGQDRLDLVRAWVEDRVSIEKLTEAFDSGQIKELSSRLSRPAVDLNEAIDTYLAARRGTVRPMTLRRYGQILAHLRRLGAKSVTDTLTSDGVEAYREQRAQEGTAPTTVNCEIATIGAFASYCVRRGWLERRPRINRTKIASRVRYLDSDQINVYMASLRAPFRPLMTVLLATGIRLGEAEGLRKHDVKAEGFGARLAIRDSKSTHGVRHAYCPAWALDAIDDLLDDLTLSDRLFTLNRRTVQNEHQRACRIAGIADYRIHDHRHTAAVHLARLGMPLPALKDQLGHATIAQTMVYARFHPDYARISHYFDLMALELGVSGDIPGGTPDDAGEEWQTGQ